MEYNTQHIQDEIKLIDAEITYAKGKLHALEDLRLRLQELLNLMNNHISGLQLPMMRPTNGLSARSTPKGKVSFRIGLIEVLQDAKGKILDDREIWKRMQLKGVISESKRPEGFIGLHEKGIKEIQKVGSNGYRWIGPL